MFEILIFKRKRHSKTPLAKRGVFNYVLFFGGLFNGRSFFDIVPFVFGVSLQEFFIANDVIDKRQCQIDNPTDRIRHIDHLGGVNGFCGGEYPNDT